MVSGCLLVWVSWVDYMDRYRSIARAKNRIEINVFFASIYEYGTYVDNKRLKLDCEILPQRHGASEL
jgi:hypothetical protein